MAAGREGWLINARSRKCYHVTRFLLLSRGRPQRYLVFRIDERTGQEDDRVRLEWEHGIVDAPHLVPL